MKMENRVENSSSSSFPLLNIQLNDFRRHKWQHLLRERWRMLRSKNKKENSVSDASTSVYVHSPYIQPFMIMLVQKRIHSDRGNFIMTQTTTFLQQTHAHEACHELGKRNVFNPSFQMFAINWKRKKKFLGIQQSRCLFSWQQNIKGGGKSAVDFWIASYLMHRTHRNVLRLRIKLKVWIFQREELQPSGWFFCSMERSNEWKISTLEQPQQERIKEAGKSFRCCCSKQKNSFYCREINAKINKRSRKKAENGFELFSQGWIIWRC